MKAALFLALVGLALTSVFAAEDIEAVEHTKYIPPCPCQCFVGYKARKAIRQCRSYIFRKRCKVLACKKYHIRGKECCDPPKPSSTPSATPTPTPSTTPSATPSPSMKPKVCPCKCTAKRWARKDCRYKPWCEIVKCEDKHVPHPYGHGYKPYRPQFKCCYKPHYAPPTY